MAEYEVRPEYCYTKGDTWVCRLADGTIRFGITDYAQKKLKEIEYLNLPEPGEAVCQGESLGEVESKICFRSDVPTDRDSVGTQQRS